MQIALPKPSLWSLDIGLEALDFGIQLQGSPNDLIPKMTSNNTPAPYVTSADSEYPGSYEAYRGADNDTATLWSSSNSMPNWWKIDLGTGNEETVQTLTIRARFDGFAQNYTPRSFTLQGSNNDSDWDDLYSATGQTWTNGQKRTYSFPNTTSYRYYRLWITETISGDNSSFSEIELKTYSVNSPVAESPWMSCKSGELDATTPIYIVENEIAALLGYSTGNVKCQYALNNGSYNGTWLTLAQLQSALAGQTITDETYSLRLKAQFNSDGTQAVDISGFGSYAEIGNLPRFQFPFDAELQGNEYEATVNLNEYDVEVAV